MDCLRAGLRCSFGSELNKLSSLYLFAFANSCGGFLNVLESGEATSRGYKIVVCKIKQCGHIFLTIKYT